MPHVIFHGQAQLGKIWEVFQPCLQQKGPWITKLTDCFLNASRKNLLVEATAVCKGVTHNFYVRIDLKSDQITIRIEPRTNVEKNDGVKWGVTMVAAMLWAENPSLELDKTNLPEEMVAALEARK